MHPLSEGAGTERGANNTAATNGDAVSIESGLAGLLKAAAVLTGAAAVMHVARGGPLDPPPGPVAPTSNPLSEIEPRIAVSATTTPGSGNSLYVITQPGSYYLTGNISVPDGLNGIRIGASGVRLDLCGFCIQPSGSAAINGITAGTVLTDVVVRNGSVVGMPNGGITLVGSEQVVVEDVVVRNNGGSTSVGGVVLGPRARVIRVQAFGNSLDGISVGNDSLLSGCIAKGNAQSGISVRLASVVENCIATNNGASGIEAGSLAVVRGCIASSNTGHGITRQGGSLLGPTISTCAAVSNMQRGIWSGSAPISGCAARANREAGIYSDGCAIEQCTSALNVSSTHAAAGYELKQGSSLAESVAYMNQGVGARVENACRVERSVMRNNSLDGIHVPILNGRSLILSNSCSGNGQAGPNTAGIRIEGGPCRIEGNLCTFGSGYGVWVTGSPNILTRNACAGNVINWNIAVNNEYGPVVDLTAPASPGMLGNGTAPSTLQTTDHHANFTL